MTPAFLQRTVNRSKLPDASGFDPDHAKARSDFTNIHERLCTRLVDDPDTKLALVSAELRILLDLLIATRSSQ
jgi:hypothetical protein